LKADFEQEEEDSWSDDEEEEECGDMDELTELFSMDLAERLIDMMVEHNPNDLDWIPEKLNNKASN
jgi:hypothetical protein